MLSNCRVCGGCDGSDELEDVPILQTAQVLLVISERVKSAETGVFCNEGDESRRERETGGWQGVLMGLWEKGDDPSKEAIRQVVIGEEITQVAFTPSFGTFCVC